MVQQINHNTHIKVSILCSIYLDTLGIDIIIIDGQKQIYNTLSQTQKILIKFRYSHNRNQIHLLQYSIIIIHDSCPVNENSTV